VRKYKVKREMQEGVKNKEPGKDILKKETTITTACVDCSLEQDQGITIANGEETEFQQSIEASISKFTDINAPKTDNETKLRR